MMSIIARIKNSADGSVIETLAELKQKDKSLWQTIKDAVADLLRRWREVLGVYEGRRLETAEARALNGMQEAFKKLQKMYAEAFAEANEVEAKASSNLSKIANNNENVEFKSTKKSSNRYSYEALTSKSEIEIRTIENVSDEEIKKYKQNSVLFGKDMREIASKSNNKKNTITSTYLHCKDLGADVLITRDSFKHGAARMDAAYIAVCKSIADVLDTSIVINELSERTGTNGGYVLLGLVESQDSYIIVRSLINKKTWKLEEYEELDAIKKKSIKKEDVGLKPPHYIHKNGYGTSSTISVADFLKYVNSQSLANSVLSLDVTQNIGSVRGFDQNVTPNLLYSERNIDSNRSLLANALESVAQTEEEARQLKSYKAKIAEIEELQKRLSEINAEIKEISFSKGKRDTGIGQHSSVFASRTHLPSREGY